MQILSSVLLVAALALGIADAAHPLAARKSSSPSTPSCSSNEFLYEERNCCLEKGGPPTPPSPPKGVGCPDEWYFHSEQSCCVPKNPLPKPAPSKPKPTPSCPQKGWSWSIGLQCCSAPPTTTHTTSTYHPSPTPQKPKGGYGWGKDKRSYNDWDSTTCPSSLDKCLYEVNGLVQGDECIDPSTNVQNCGGCSINGPGVDCTKIAHAVADSVSCAQSICVVEKCESGYEPSDDDSSCVAA